MGMLVNGKWQVQVVNPNQKDGEFRRQETSFRKQVSSKPGAEHPPESGRYHLYVAKACPWAHRTLIYLNLKGLEEHISVSIVNTHMSDDGWSFEPSPGSTPDHLFDSRFLREIYVKADPTFTGRVTVPVLWDKKLGTIVSNESAEIIRMFNSEFDSLTQNNEDFYPESLREEIDATNEVIYRDINNGVYKTGFATTQDAYDKNVKQLFRALDDLEVRLSEKDFLLGRQITEADWRLFTTLIRFDAVYYGHFKCNLRQIRDYPHLAKYLEKLHAVPGVAETIDIPEIKAHYYGSHTSINPTGIVPIGPELKLIKEK